MLLAPSHPPPRLLDPDELLERAVGRRRGVDLLDAHDGLPAAAVAPAGARAGAAVDRVELLEAAAGADGDAGERRLGEMHRHVRLVPQALVQALQQRSA